MAEKPILFSAPMVNAILDGRKSMTRRIVKPQPEKIILMDGKRCQYIKRAGDAFAADIVPAGMPTYVELTTTMIGCPYGKPGDTLWVRETFAVNCVGGQDFLFYRANSYPDGDGVPWKSSIFMPRKYSRITLRITDVRVERLQDVTPDDCIREGVKWVDAGPNFADITGAFRSLWDGINTKQGYGWDANPYVWVVSFEKI